MLYFYRLCGKQLRPDLSIHILGSTLVESNLELKITVLHISFSVQNFKL